MQHFISKWVSSVIENGVESRKINVLDVGGADYNGSYRQLFPSEFFNYLVCDIEASQSVDLLRDTDILITDQSSVLYEAMLCGIPTIVIEGWKHACGNCAGPQPSPDATLVSGISEINAVLHYAETHYRKLQRIQLKNRRKNFTNLGNASNTTLSKVIGVWQSMTNSRVLYGR